MGNVVAARRLRKSAMNNRKTSYLNNLGDIGISDIEIRRKIREHEREEGLDYDNEDDGNKFKMKFKTKFIFKVFLAVNIIFVCLVCKLLFADKITSNKYVSMIINEYNNDYSKAEILENVEEIAKLSYNATKYVVPEGIANYVSSNYVEYVKPYLKDFDLKQEVINVFNKEENKVEPVNAIPSEPEEKLDEQSEEGAEQNQNAELDGKGGGEPAEEVEHEELTQMDKDIKDILAKNINIALPVKGTVTSRYGDRDQIFEGVDPYHTGIDIANVLNTPITSATDGVVISTQEMNKYYGNNIVIEKDGVTFKYAHLNEIKVKQGDNITQGDVIGLMGSTGMSTGSHLHFEIRIENRSIDPDKILKF